jgi:Prophage antirepressor
MSETNELKVIDERTVLGKNFRIFGTFDDPLFLAKDVAEWIEHSNTSKMISDAGLTETDVITQRVGTLTNSYSALFLTEDGLYEVLMQSRKPLAKEFKKQVKEILKTIRKTGGFVADNREQP